MHDVGLIGGTFDRFHAGHLALMATGLSVLLHRGLDNCRLDGSVEGHTGEPLESQGHGD